MSMCASTRKSVLCTRVHARVCCPRICPCVVSESLSVFPSLWVRVFIPMCKSLHLHVSIRIWVCISVYPCLWVNQYVRISAFVYSSPPMPVCVSASACSYPCTYLSLSLSLARLRVCVCVLTQCAKNGLCACTLHATSGLPTTSRHTRCLLFVLASDSDLTSSKTRELTIKLWGKPESVLDIEIISRIILTTIKSPLLVKTSHIPVHTSHAKGWPFKYWWSVLSSKVCKKIQVHFW